MSLVVLVCSDRHDHCLWPSLSNPTLVHTNNNNYRAIALSNAISKILEHILYDFIANEDAVDDFQFGFKKGHSTSDCTFVLKTLLITTGVMAAMYLLIRPPVTVGLIKC